MRFNLWFQLYNNCLLSIVYFLLLMHKQDFMHSKNKKPLLGNAATVMVVKPKPGCYVFWLFYKMGRCSAISLKRFRRELSIDVAEHRSILKNKRVMLILVIFKVGPCSAIQFKRFWWELSIDMAEHTSTLKNTGVVCILVIFLGRPVCVQPYLLKGRGESFPLIWLNLGLCWKMTKIRTPVLVSRLKLV